MPTSLEIVSPDRLLLSRPVDMVVIPASEGDMGVLEGHAPMIVMLRGGLISLYEGDRVTDTLFVAGGFAEVFEDMEESGNVTLLRAWRSRRNRVAQLGDSSDPRVSKTS